MITETYRKLKPAKALTAFAMLTCVLLFACASCEKSEPAAAAPDSQIAKTYQRGPVTVHVRIDKDNLNLAQTLSLELETIAQPPYEVKMPDLHTVLEDFSILDFDRLPDRLDPNNHLVTTRR